MSSTQSISKQGNHTTGDNPQKQRQPTVLQRKQIWSDQIQTVKCKLVQFLKYKMCLKIEWDTKNNGRANLNTKCNF